MASVYSTTAMASSNFDSRLLALFLLSTCCQHHALILTSGTLAPTSDSTLGKSLPGPADGVVNSSTAAKDDPVPAADFFLFDGSPWSKAKSSWPARDTESFSPTTLYRRRRRPLATDPSSNNSRRVVGNHTSHADTEATVPSASVSFNGNATEPMPLRQQELPGAHLRPRRKSGSASKARKSLCSYRRTTSLLHGRLECSGVVVVVVAGSVLLVLLCSFAVAGLLLLRGVHGKRQGEIAGAAADPEDDGRDDRPAPSPGLVRRAAAGPRRYSYGTLAAATGNFAERKRIGRGGFGSVYREFLQDQDRHVAVKTFAAAGSPEQGRREFEAEAEVMSQLQHRNLVQLVGWSDGHKGLLLVYELVPGGCLHKHLHDPDMFLTWPERYKITLDLGAAILYLHTECEQCVVHGDIKPSNVMLDMSGNAKLGDFGLARLVDHGAEPRTTQVVAGTLGYVDPEFVSDRRRGTESDVYSFGVVLLEIACGSRPTAPGQPKKEASRLLNRVRRCLCDRNAILDAADRRLGGEFDERQMERVLFTGPWCADRDRSRRPSIAQAMDVLRSANSEMPILPAVALQGGRGEIRVLEERAYGDLSTEDDDDESTISSTSTAYLSLEDSRYPPRNHAE